MKKNLTGEAVFSPSLEVYNKVHIPYEKRISDSQNPRMICIGQNFKAHSIPTLCHEQGPLSLDQVAPRPLQPSLEHFWDGATCARASPPSQPRTSSNYSAQGMKENDRSVCS